MMEFFDAVMLARMQFAFTVGSVSLLFRSILKH
jgi:hypothetical protein